MNELYHHGILGMKWGIRRYQNPDGSLTDEGRRRYNNQGDTVFERAARTAYFNKFKTEEDVKKAREAYKKYDDAWAEWYFNEDKSKTPELENRLDGIKNDLYGNIYGDMRKFLEKELGEVNDDSIELGELAVMEMFDVDVIEPVRKEKIRHSSLSHSFKGTTWKEHKYIRKEGDHYIYSKEAAKSGAYDNDIDAKKEKIEELYTVKIHHQEALAKAQENGDTASAEVYQTYINNIDKQISELEDELNSLNDHKYAKYMSPGNARKITHSVINTSYLSHHGILGMKWGIRRYQNPDGSLTDEGRERYGVGGVREGSEESKSKFSPLSIFKKKKKEEEHVETPEEHEARRQSALAKGSAKEVMEFQGELTNQELNNAILRIQYEKRLKDIIAEDEPSVKKGLDKAEEIMATVGRVRAMSESAINAYNTVAKVVNTVEPDSKLPIIGEKQKTSEEKAKENAIKSANRELLSKYKGKLDAKEVNDAMKILEKWEDFDNPKDSDKSSGDFSFDNMSKKDKKKLKKILDDYMDDRESNK